MSSENKKHQGSIFFPLPDGTGLHYHLEGTAEAPRCSGAISRWVPCRNSHMELIPLSNWLHRPQRFLVVIDMLKPENLEGSSVLQGCSYINVPSSAKRDYQLTFLSYKKGVFSAKANLVLEYQPLKTGESTGLQNSDFGSPSYKLQLKATSSRPEKPVYFRTTLGSRQTITNKIWNFAQQKTEYFL